ncbi:MAG: hypothetical protein QNJ46_34430 [Leptolyngbyaceae cyanobacterium MO_188.B28]|nr:hypothetical protein [Leptolyngbyaceae cyanobacterium MO_188.B28]
MEVVHEKEFLKVTPHKKLNSENSAQLVERISAEVVSAFNCPVLLDLRLVKFQLSIAGVNELVKKLREYNSIFTNRIAILRRSDQEYDSLTYLTACANNRGMRMKLFTEYELAIRWLKISIPN